MRGEYAQGPEKPASCIPYLMHLPGKRCDHGIGAGIILNAINACLPLSGDAEHHLGRIMLMVIGFGTWSPLSDMHRGTKPVSHGIGCHKRPMVRENGYGTSILRDLPYRK